MPVPPAEVTAEVTIHDERSENDSAVRAGFEVAKASGLALEAGPDTTALSGGRAEVLEALRDVISAALDASAPRISITIEAQTQSR
jgi:uncharacterized protein YqgV (UPF0045/DUF77 family)